ncbi:unnamed protein product [Aureobasidium pullulans]|nr:unnamed protein product [Aureobasidium pullulans]
MSFLGGSAASSSASQTQAIKQQVAQEAAVANARQLVERCIPKPGSSLSSGESTCYSQCMEKYMSAWNVVSKQYINRIQREAGSGALM